MTLNRRMKVRKLLRKIISKFSIDDVVAHQKAKIQRLNN